MAESIPGDATQRIDFTNQDNRRVLEEAHALIVGAYELLLSLGVKRPADNQFLRESLLCAQAGLIWSGARGEADAETVAGEEVEVKSTVFGLGGALSFPTSRDIQPRVLERWRQANFWIFGIFDQCERMLAQYRVSRASMAPIIARLEVSMKQRHREGKILNNPHLSFAEIRAVAETTFLHSGFRDWQTDHGVWKFGTLP